MTRDDFADRIETMNTLVTESGVFKESADRVGMFRNNALMCIGAQLCDLESTLKAGLADIAAAVKGPTNDQPDLTESPAKPVPVDPRKVQVNTLTPPPNRGPG